MEAPLCNICDFDLEDHYLECGNPSCIAKTCEDCVEGYMVIAVRENILPVCLEYGCHGVLMYSAISRMNSKIVNNFLSACLGYIMRDKLDEVQADLTQKKAIQELRRKRIEFVNTQFPAAIALVAGLTCKSKLNRVKKSISGKEPISRNMTRVCMNLFCSGLLDDEFICISCSTQFCKECEERLESNHQCLKENIESVRFTRTMVKCPSCSLPIERSEGCPSMTCANCGANFDFLTGKGGGHGNNGSSKKVKAAEKIRLSNVYKDKFTTEQLQIVLLIESKEPAIKSEVKIHNLVKKLLQRQITESAAKLKSVIILEEYYGSRYSYMQFHRIMVAVEDLIRKDTITTEKLIHIYQQI